MKKIFLSLILAASVFGLVICGNNFLAFAQEDVIELKFNDWGPPGIGIGKIHQKAAKMIEERTNGRVKVHCYFSQSLLKYSETFRGISSNITDLSLYSGSSGKHEVHKILAMGFSGLPDMFKSSKIFEEMINKYPEFNQEFEKNGVKWLSVRALLPTQLHTVKKQVRLPEDMKGMRIIVTDPNLADSFKKVNAASLRLAPPDWYSSLERGVAQGQMVQYAAAYEFKIQELFKYHTHFGEGAGGTIPLGFVVNLKKWNSLPPDIQKVIVDVYQWANDEGLKWDAHILDEAVNQAKEDGHIIMELSPAETQVWLDWAKPSHEKVLKEIESQGWPARRIYDGMQQLIQKYK